MAEKRPLESVNLLFKTHLDLGFTDSASAVMEQYRKQFIPEAIRVARALRESDAEARMIWTTGSWLIWQYLEQTGGRARADMEQAILDGDIVWHGLPFTTHTELLDRNLMRFGLDISARLDRRFGKRTTGAKMTDVPGHTIGMVPLLAEAGIRMLHLGVNAASSPPDVPSRFIWRHPDGSEVIVIYDKDDYGGEMVLGSRLFKFIHTHDNLGPSSEKGVRKAFRDARNTHHPDRILPATLNTMAEAALECRGDLPVVDQEIGDSWIHGTGTDPWKTSRFRALTRLIEPMKRWESFPGKEAVIAEVENNLLCVSEHTWGMDEKTALSDYGRYSADRLAVLRKTKKCLRFESSWKEQRDYIGGSMKALMGTPFEASAREVLTELEPEKPDTEGFEPPEPGDLSTRWFDLAFDGETGALSYLKETAGDRVWCSGSSRLGLFGYETFSSADYRRFSTQYQKNMLKTFVWSIPDFRKPGMFLSRPEHRLNRPAVKSLLRRDDRFLMELSMPEKAVETCGCPRSVWLSWDFLIDRPAVEISLQWFDKKACRLPEASWFSFSFDNTAAEGWRMDKLGSRISPLDVVSRGGRTLHAVGQGVFYGDRSGSLSLETPDAQLVSFDSLSLLDFHNRVPDPRKGVHINLHNNVWGTNFPMWYEDDARFRFILDFAKR